MNPKGYEIMVTQSGDGWSLSADGTTATLLGAVCDKAKAGGYTRRVRLRAARRRRCNGCSRGRPPVASPSLPRLPLNLASLAPVSSLAHSRACGEGRPVRTLNARPRRARARGPDFAELPAREVAVGLGAVRALARRLPRRTIARRVLERIGRARRVALRVSARRGAAARLAIRRADPGERGVHRRVATLLLRALEGSFEVRRALTDAPPDETALSGGAFGRGPRAAGDALRRADEAVAAARLAAAPAPG